MYKSIEYRGKKLEFLSTMATAIRYRQVFHKDALVELRKLKTAMSSNEITSEATEIIPQLAYIMMAAADGQINMNKLNYDSYIEWAEKWEPQDFSIASDLFEVVLDVWSGQDTSTSELKKGESSSRPVTTGLLLLRAKELGFSLEELDNLEMGVIYDAIIERANDDYKYPPEKLTQQEQEQKFINAFFGG